MLDSRLVAAVVKTADYKANLYVNHGEFLYYKFINLKFLPFLFYVFYVLYLGNCIKIHFSEKINCSFFSYVRKLTLCVHIFYLKFQASQLNSQRN